MEGAADEKKEEEEKEEVDGGRSIFPVVIDITMNDAGMWNVENEVFSEEEEDEEKDDDDDAGVVGLRIRTAWRLGLGTAVVHPVSWMERVMVMKTKTRTKT